MGFIGYMTKQGGDDKIVRIFMECRESSDQGTPVADRTGKILPNIRYTYAVDVVFPGGKAPCRLRGVDGILALKKFYKLIQSLEERAREHGNSREKVAESAEGLLEHLAYTRNARDFTGLLEPGRAELPEETPGPECGALPPPT